MREMFRQTFSAITTLFCAIERGAKTLDNYAKWAEGESEDFVLTSEIERTKRRALLSAE
jgi:hypothetical protein